MLSYLIQRFRFSPPIQPKPALRPKGRPVDPWVVEKNLFILNQFIQVYCRGHHGERGRDLCAECRDLLEYARTRVEKCPYEPKPKCKECPTHCYKPDYRQRMKEVMKYSGMYYVKRGRLDWLVRYFLARSV
ncbi:MAG: nitrous oxide-stimulated promoter family protein [bacterium]